MMMFRIGSVQVTGMNFLLLFYCISSYLIYRICRELFLYENVTCFVPSEVSWGCIMILFSFLLNLPDKVFGQVNSVVKMWLFTLVILLIIWKIV